ncbi:response regulator transcription factor [Vogesella sp. LIG4]|uniref:response regulator transcription factor n=1 Tax=Vogesella sp. LIG4 TaxID=1192162 RepID=UPI00081F87EA|nr:response regulator [Vogesella sp. LIG4]SCK29224.1 Response regulators consisting of a CheY-like receiver domain and a winged-helix DNA-binding domain [Vogesella sp. LIG4]
MSEATLLIVEDSQSQCALYRSLFDGLYTLQFAATGLAALDSVAGSPPDAILLDVELPDIDGYRVCQQLRSNGHELPILFVSSHGSLEDRLQGYDAGGNDFLRKPIDGREIVLKVALALRAHAEKRELQQSGQHAFSAAMTAMSAMSEMGVLIDFIRNASRLASYGDIAAAICGTLEAYGLHGCAQVYGSSGETTLSTDGSPSALEASIIANARTLSHIYSSGCNTSFNYPNCCLIVRDMPVDDDTRCGRLRDHLAILAEVAAARAQALDELQQQTSTLQQQLDALHSAVLTLRRELPAAGASLGLSDEQQQRLVRLFDSKLAEQGKR